MGQVLFHVIGALISMADPSKPVAGPTPGLVQTSNGPGKGNTVYMWGGVINPFNKYSKLSDGAADDTLRVENVARATPQLPSQPPGLTVSYQEMLDIANNPKMALQEKAGKLLANRALNDKTLGTSSPEQQQIDRLARDTSNKFLDSQYQAVTGALRLGAGQNEAALHSPQLDAEAVASVQRVAIQMEELGLQSAEISYSRFGTTGEVVNDLIGRLSEANVIDGFGNRVEQAPVNKGKSVSAKPGGGPV